MKNLILILCVALTASAEVPVASIAEQMKTVATLLQVHHHRFTRQVTMPPIPTTPTTPTNLFEQPACQLALQNYVQRCFVDQGVDPSVLATNRPSNTSALYFISEFYCGDDDCQKAFLNYYVECVGSELVVSITNATFRALCQMHDNGAFCYEVFFNSGTDLQEIVNATSIVSCFRENCTEECFQELTKLASFGCCTNEYFRSVEAIDINIANLFKGLWGVCGFEDPGYCNGTGTPTIGTPTTPTPPTPPPTPPTPTGTMPPIPTTPTTPTNLFEQPACQLALRNYVQRCFVDQGVDPSVLATISPSNPSALYVILSELYCGDDDCQKALLNFYVECVGSELVVSITNATFRALCQMHDNGSFCYEVFFNSGTDLQEIVNATNIASCFLGNCTEQCFQELTKLASFGCCTNEYFRSLEAIDINIANQFKGVWGVCGLEDPGYCNGMGTPTTPCPTVMSTISPTYTTPIPIPFPPIPRNSKCARKSRALSADQNCSGGVNIGELLRNRSAQFDTARISQLHSHFCSSQKCFNQYVKTYTACQVHLRGADGNATAEKVVVQEVYNVLVPYTRKLFCSENDGQFCAIRFPEILSPNFSNITRVCATTPPKANCSKDCCDAVRCAVEKYGCCFREFWDLLPPSRLPCLRDRVWRKCGIPKPPRCRYVLRKPRKPRN